MLGGEKPPELFRRLKSLALAMKIHGCKDNHDECFKGKFLKTIIPYDQNLEIMINQRPDYPLMTPSEVLASFVTMDMMSKSSDHAIVHARVAKTMYLALKASKAQVEDDDCGGSDTCLDRGDVDVAWNEHMALESILEE